MAKKFLYLASPVLGINPGQKQVMVMPDSVKRRFSSVVKVAFQSLLDFHVILKA